MQEDTRKRRFRRREGGALLGALLLAGWLVACDRSQDPARRPTASGPRVISLSPAITQMARDLGLEEAIVGVGEYDPVAPPAAEVVGDLDHLDYEKLLRLRPTHVFLQPGLPGVPTRLKRMAESHGWKLHSYVIHTVEDVLRTLHRPSGSTGEIGVGRALGVEEEAAQLARDLRGDLQRLAALTRGREARRTLLLIGLQPMTGVGPPTFLGEMLQCAGGQNVLDGVARPYPVLDREKLLSLAPEVIVVIRSTEANPDASVEAPQRYLSGLSLPALETGSVFCLEDRLALLPTTSMARIARRLAELLHPDLASAIERQEQPQETRR